MAKRQYHIGALARGVAILTAVASGAEDMNLTEIASAVGVSTSTTFGFLRALEGMGYLERNPSTRRYRTGLKLLGLSLTVLGRNRLADSSLPYLQELAESTGESADIAIRDGAEVTFVALVALTRVRRVLSVNVQARSRLPVYCTSTGKAMLMDMSREELRDLLGEGPWPARTSRTVTTLDALVADLELARRRGYATQDEEFEIGLGSAAAPVRDQLGGILAAVSISYPTARVPPEKLEELAPMVVRTAREVSLALGPRVDKGR